MTFGAPLDPRYVAFRDGIKKANDDITDQSRWRWAPGHDAWYTYDQAWIMDDVGLPDTSPLYGNFASDGGVNDFWVPEIFKRIDEFHRKYMARYPDHNPGGGLVWTWRNGGDWRVARLVPGSGGGPGSTTKPDPALPPECLKRIEDVREYERQGMITAQQAQRLINQIVEECT